MFVQGAVVPHEELEGGVEGPDVVGPSYPRLVGGQAVATVRVAGRHHKHVLWHRLHDSGGREGEKTVKIWKIFALNANFALSVYKVP